MIPILEHGYDTPESTYFRTKDAQPELVQDTEGNQVLKLVNGRGRGRSWRSPQVTSTVILQEEDLVAIHVGFSHKHGGDQFWRYYCPNAQGVWQQVYWTALPDEERLRVLAAYDEQAPGWADRPGKLRAERSLPSHREYTTYKIVQVREDGIYASIYNPEVIYTLGKRRTEVARPDHGGGYYSYRDREMMQERFWEGELFHKRYYARLPEMTLALVECLAEGRVIVYGRRGEGKIASTHLTLVRELDRFVYTLRSEEIA